MLLSFTVENFRSIKNSLAFSMIPTSYKELEDSGNIREVTKSVKITTVAAIYGANSSGKSNFIRAMGAMRRIILTSIKLNASEDLPADPFVLDDKSPTRPTTFEAKFFSNQRTYRYGFTFNSKEIIKEWLYETAKVKEHALFLRENGNITIGKKFEEGEGKIELTAKNRLFLSLVAQLNGKTSKQIIEWFQHFNNISGLNNENFRDFSIDLLLKKDLESKAAMNFLKQMDLGFSDLKPIEQNLDESFFPPDMPIKLKESILKQHANEKVLFLESKHKIHRNDGTTTEKFFQFDDMESDGTLKIFDLSGPIINTLLHGYTLVVDELDAKLHPLLTRRIVKIFNSPKGNPNNAQLIFATHDTNLLDINLLRRDQIWLTKKNKDDETTSLKQLSEILVYDKEKGEEKKVRNDRIFEKDYLSGDYKAIPDITEDFDLTKAMQE